MLKILNKLNKGANKPFILLVISSIGTMLITILTPQLYKDFIDLLIDGNLNYLVWIVSGYLIFYFITLILDYSKNYLTNKLVNRTLYNLRKEILIKYMTMDFSEYQIRNFGDLKMRIDDDTNHIVDFASYQTIQYLISVIISFITIVMLVKIEVILAAFSVVSIPVTIYIDHKISVKEKELNYDNRVNDQNADKWLYFCIQGWKETKSLNLQNNNRIKFTSYLHKSAILFARWINYWVLRRFIVPKIRDEFLFKFCLYFFGGLLIIKGKITIGSLLVFVQYFTLLYQNINNISTTDADLQSNLVYYNKLIDELSPKNVNNKKKKIIPKCIMNDLVFQNVSFKYKKQDKYLFNNTNFHIHGGERIALAGRSGLGKTTLVKLMSGMLSPSSGMIYWNNTNINDINIDYIYKKVGIVMQENILFNTSIKENLLLSKQFASDNEIINACKKACIYNFITSLPESFDTIIGEHGVKLSGGQRQRIVLARLFLRDFDTIILDEATSAIDSYSESFINDALNNIDNNKTIIIISHRQSSLSFCNRVIELNDNGNVIINNNIGVDIRC